MNNLVEWMNLIEVKNNQSYVKSMKIIVKGLGFKC